MIEEGAVELMVPGNLPIGCSVLYLTLFQSPNKTHYDTRNGCLKAFNAFSKFHNRQLTRALESLRLKYPHAKIIYADNYGATIRFVHAPLHYGKLITVNNIDFKLEFWTNQLFTFCVEFSLQILDK